MCECVSVGLCLSFVSFSSSFFLFFFSSLSLSLSLVFSLYVALSGTHSGVLTFLSSMCPPFSSLSSSSFLLFVLPLDDQEEVARLVQERYNEMVDALRTETGDLGELDDELGALEEKVGFPLHPSHALFGVEMLSLSLSRLSLSLSTVMCAYSSVDGQHVGHPC
jgi:hypothetical protein